MFVRQFVTCPPFIRPMDLIVGSCSRLLFALCSCSLLQLESPCQGRAAGGPDAAEEPGLGCFVVDGGGWPIVPQTLKEGAVEPSGVGRDALHDGVKAV